MEACLQPRPTMTGLDPAGSSPATTPPPSRDKPPSPREEMPPPYLCRPLHQEAWVSPSPICTLTKMSQKFKSLVIQKHKPQVKIILSAGTGVTC